MQPIVAWQGHSFKIRNRPICFALPIETVENISIVSVAYILLKVFKADFANVI
jgi:hypothetical protein